MLRALFNDLPVTTIKSLLFCANDGGAPERLGRISL